MDLFASTATSGVTQNANDVYAQKSEKAGDKIALSVSAV